jgi:hypothetical protein
MVPLRPLAGVAAYAIIAAVTIGLLYYGSALLIPVAVAIVIWHLINALASTYHGMTLGHLRRGCSGRVLVRSQTDLAGRSARRCR